MPAVFGGVWGNTLHADVSPWYAALDELAERPVKPDGHDAGLSSSAWSPERMRDGRTVGPEGVGTLSDRRSAKPGIQLAEPGAAALVEALRAVGYDACTAVA